MSYYTVMIVEKKAQMIHIYKNMLPWENYGFKIVTTTDNEDKALAYYGEYRFDLIFTGIDLKEGNGISLIKQIKYLNSKAKIIVVSNHEDYDSVRDAFCSGADDFILKSRLRYSLLANVLEKIKNELDLVKCSDIDNNWMEKIAKLLGFIRDKQKIDTNIIIELLKNGHIDILNGEYRMLYYRMDNIRIFNRMMRQYDKPNWMSNEEFISMFQDKLAIRDTMQIKVSNIIKNILKDIPNVRLIYIKKHSGLILLPDLDKKVLLEYAQKIINEILDKLKYEYSITISSKEEGIESFVDMYKKVIEYHEHKFYDGDTIIEDMDENKKYKNLNFDEIDYHHLIEESIQKRRYDQALVFKEQAVSYMIEHKIVPDEVKKYFEMIIEKLEKITESKIIEMHYPFEVLKQGIDETESIMYLRIELDKILKTLIDWLQQDGITQYKKKVSLVIQFIQKNIDKPISLAMIANEVCLSEIHISRLFKKETGKSVIEYINEEKMKIAKKLLENETIKIKDVANQIGFKDQLYFSKIFKKQFGISPREYRKKL